MALAIVTGGNRGIGLALVELLRKRDARVIATCRRASPELEALGAEIVDGVEVTEDAGIARLAGAVGTREVDLLINNAGIMQWPGGLAELDVAAIRRQF